MNTNARPSIFNPKESLFPADTPASDLVTGVFLIDFSRAISNPDLRAKFAAQPTSIHYRIHKRTNLAEVKFLPPPGDFEFILHVRDFGYDGPLTDEDFAARVPPDSVDAGLPAHLVTRTHFLNDVDSRLGHFGGRVKPNAQCVCLPVMNDEQPVRMVETMLVTIFTYIVDICAAHAGEADVLRYAAEHVEKPIPRVWHELGLLGTAHYLACEYLLDLK
ncbi:hypothetical protein GGF32_008066 [Allomyces javanicus]|nr:hypothetical protein GGF32_008066 [Allomyces javanicus]